MGFLLRRTKRALAGWYDAFKRTESPIQKPWEQWGAARTVYVDGANERMVVATDSGGWFQPRPDGGVAYEHQPLTPYWAVEFEAKPQNNADGQLLVFLDKNWTQGGQAATTRYQTFLKLERSTSEPDENGNRTVTYSVRLFSRDKDGGWLAVQSFGFNLNSSEWSAGGAFKVVVFADKIVALSRNGQTQAIGKVYSSLYEFGPNNRSANFKGQAGYDWYIKKFATYDRPNLAALPWVSDFHDSFDRADTTTGAGNGWNSLGSNHGILDNAYSMRQPFPPPSDGRRGIYRGGISKGDMRIDFGFGGGTGGPNSTAETVVLGRVNAAGSLGIGAHMGQTKIQLVAFSGAVNAPTYTDITASLAVYGGDIAMGQTFAFCILGDEAWIERISDGAILCWSDGINAISPESNRGVAVIVRRQLFTNSAPVNDIRVSVAA